MTTNPRRLILRHEGSSSAGGRYVLYWMQQAQRVHYNHALLRAIERANEARLPVRVAFVLFAGFPEANVRHFTFMLEGLKEVGRECVRRGIGFELRRGEPVAEVTQLLQDAAAVVCDTGYLSHQRAWRDRLTEVIRSRFPQVALEEVDTDAVVPVRAASDHAEYGAYTLRPKLLRMHSSFLDFAGLPAVAVAHPPMPEPDDSMPAGIDASVPPVTAFAGGHAAAYARFERFLNEAANRYPESNDPGEDLTSGMSPYLHFGQISALELIDRLSAAHAVGALNGTAYEAYVEQLLVRRELAINYVWFRAGYDRFETMTEPWAYRTMQAHADDPRDPTYSEQAIETGRTDDPYFNAAMKEMRETGYMHGYMRMYWAKKIIEWTPSHEAAYRLILRLNNRLFLDGRDANSYAGIAWCFGKHDRPWGERPVFGQLRYMNDQGLKRKFDMRRYLKRVGA